jgi:hypothetical protein
MSKQKTSRGAARSGKAPRPTPSPNGASVAVAPPAAPTRSEEERRAARLQRQEQARAAAARRRQMLRLRNIGIGVAALVLIVAGIAVAVINEANKPGQGFAMDASPHIATVDSPHLPYSTDPPTSGPHVPQVPNWGIHSQPIAKELQVHGLEDGGVIINYQPNLDKAVVAQLEQLTSSYESEVIVAPYENLSSPIVLTAWIRMQKFDTFDEAGIRRFIDAFRGIDHHGESGT